jgi:hypothetical protein
VRIPDFFIVGAMKSGTTSLASWLRAHPDVFVPAAKELHYFTDRWDRGPEWYAEQFAGCDGARCIGEATPTYLLSEAALRRMHDVAPKARVIVLAREPVERAYSHHKHWRRKGEPRSFAETCAEELALGRPPGSHLWEAERRDYRYLAPGRYARQLQTLCGIYPRDQVLVVFTDDLEHDAAGTFATVCGFLGVDPGVRPEVLGSRENAAVVLRPLWLWWILIKTRFGKWAPKPVGAWVFRRMSSPDDLTPELSSSLRAALREHFAADNAELAAWLGRDVPAGWSTPD